MRLRRSYASYVAGCYGNKAPGPYHAFRRGEVSYMSNVLNVYFCNRINKNGASCEYVRVALPSAISMTCKQPSGWVVLCFMPLAAVMSHLVASEQLFFMWKWFSSQAHPFLLSLNPSHLFPVLLLLSSITLSTHLDTGFLILSLTYWALLKKAIALQISLMTHNGLFLELQNSRAFYVNGYVAPSNKQAWEGGDIFLTFLGDESIALINLEVGAFKVGMVCCFPTW